MGSVNYLESRLRSMLYSFRASILFYPITFSFGAIALFLLTNLVDESIDGVQLTVDVPLLRSLVFAGSPDAARSILSTIATGWATILGVAFSVTLIALQLSVTKHTSELISEFQSERVNQLMLGWFVATVVYSLLALKTVRVADANSEVAPFTPTLGVNVAVLLAIVALFIFIVFLHNVTSYLKANTLIGRIVNRVLASIKKAGQRRVDKRAAYDYRSLPALSARTAEVNAPVAGILRSVNWKRMAGLLSKERAHSHILEDPLWIEWTAEVGEYVQKNAVIANIYLLKGDRDPARAEEEQGRWKRALEKGIISSIDIGEGRDVSTDPKYGLEVLRNIAIKGISQSDISTVNACVSGLFSVLFHAISAPEVLGFPFKLAARDDDSVHLNVTVQPKEQRIRDIVFFELSAIYRAAEPSSLAAVTGRFAADYIALSKNLIHSNKSNEFAELTGWYSELLKTHIPLSDSHGLGEVKSLLLSFGKELREKHPHVNETFDIHMRPALSAEA